MDDELAAIVQGTVSDEHFLCWEGKWRVEKKPIFQERICRKTLFYAFRYLVALGVAKKIAPKTASSVVRKLWNEEAVNFPTELPLILQEDGFIRMYSEASPLVLGFFRHLVKRMQQPVNLEKIPPPIFLEETVDAASFHDVNATPPGFIPKISSAARLKGEEALIKKIQSDLNRMVHIGDVEKRRALTLAILAHGASYRELDGKVLYLPILSCAKPMLIPYGFRQHLLWEGIKTLSLFPMEKEDEERGIYLCQGTEIWPSQPSMLGSIFANFGKEGVATEPYAHSWRQIHKHLKDLAKIHPPYVAGHSLGGSLAMQIMLYSHALLHKAYIFNASGLEERDFQLYQRLPSEVQEKVRIYASIDDLAFWRMGRKIVGKITLYIGERRWRYRPLKKWEFLSLIPAMIKSIINMINALPAHQKIVPLLSSYIYFMLTPEEIARENAERVTRFDHLDFFPRLYLPLRAFLKLTRTLFGWRLFDTYLKSQLEIIALHEEELEEIIAHGASEESLEQLQLLRQQKEELLKRIKK